MRINMYKYVLYFTHAHLHASLDPYYTLHQTSKWEYCPIPLALSATFVFAVDWSQQLTMTYRSRKLPFGFSPSDFDPIIHRSTC